MEEARFSDRRGARRAARILFPIAAFLLLATPVAPGPEPPAPGATAASLRVEPVRLDERDPGRSRIGGLIFLGGWALESDDPRFGGISAMHVADGEVVAVSDAGTLLRFALPPRSGGVVRLGPLPGADVPGAKWTRDSESMAVRGDRAWIGFEGGNVVRRYRLPDLTEQAAARPRTMSEWPTNSGAEAIVRLRDGRFQVFAEGDDEEGPFSEAILFAADPAERGTPSVALRYRRPHGYRITDAALLPDGRLLLLTRRFHWMAGFSVKLLVADTRRLAAGATIEAREVADLRPPLTVDNMEALSVTREGGRTIVWIASDDNFTPLQQTLLLKFALAP